MKYSIPSVPSSEYDMNEENVGMMHRWQQLCGDREAWIEREFSKRRGTDSAGGKSQLFRSPGFKWNIKSKFTWRDLSHVTCRRGSGAASGNTGVRFILEDFICKEWNRTGGIHTAPPRKLQLMNTQMGNGLGLFAPPTITACSGSGSSSHVRSNI